MTIVIDSYERNDVAPANPDGVTWLHRMWADDPSWTNPGDGNLVDSWRNASGGGDPAATGSLRPTFRASVEAYNKKAAVQFSNAQALDFNIADIAQPFSVVAVANVGRAGIAEKWFGKGAGTGNGIGDTSGNTWLANMGSTIGTGASDSNPHLFRLYANGASSVLAVDGIVDSAGNAGTAACARITIGAGSDGVPNFANFLGGHVAMLGIATGDVTTDTEWANFKQFVRQFYGRVIA